MKNLYLFPGAHKTGTSLLQGNMESWRDEITAQGFSIARRGQYYSTGFHLDLRKPMNPDARLEEELVTKLERIFGESYNDKNIILSIENIFGEFGGAGYNRAGAVLRNLKIIFPEHRIKCILYVRRQDTFLESNYVQAIQKGATISFEEFYETNKEANLDWFLPIKQVKRNIGEGSFVLDVFETIRDGVDGFIERFYQHMPDLTYMDFANVVKDEDRQTNISLSTLGLKVAQAGFPFFEKRLDRENFARHLQDILGVDKHPRFKMPEELRINLGHNYREVNRVLMKRHNLPKKFVKYYSFKDLIK